jgi:ADP-heptose:LPS heptosyltransferase
LLVKEKPYFVLHPYSRWTTKLWPWRNYIQLIESMPEAQFVVVGNGPWFPIGTASITSKNVLDLREKLTLPQLISVLAHARAIVSTDSGPAHLAAALNRPTLVLFGPTDPQKTRPVGGAVTVITHPLPCAPCLKRYCRRDLPMECMSGIAVHPVADWLRHASRNGYCPSTIVFSKNYGNVSR